MNRNIFFVIIAATVLAFAIAFSRYHIERKKHRKRASEALYTLIMDNSILAAIGALLLLVILVIAGFDLDQDDILDVKALVTILFTGVIGLLLMVGRGYAINKLEDSIKLTHDYKGLLSQYRAEKRWYTYRNSISDSDNYGQLSSDEKSSFTKNNNNVKFPVIIDCWLNDMPIDIQDSNEMYKLPEEIKPFEAELFQAHDTSHLYNQLNVKVKDWGVQDHKFVIHSARTTYFKSMVTNRVMDFRMKNEMTVRDILQYGPFVPDIAESALSNHLGFNGFIITSDNKLPLVKRRNTG